MEKKQSKIVELSNLISQYEAGERERINADEYPQWVAMLDMLKSAEIADEIFDEFIAHPEQYKVVDGEIVFNENYEEDNKKKEELRVANLTMTALDFITLLENNGLDYKTQIAPFLEENADLEKQLKYCQRVYCGVVQQLCPLKLDDVTLTKEDIITAFKAKNGEV